MHKIDEVQCFIDGFQMSDQIPAMEKDLEKAIGYNQWVGMLLNDAVFDYEKHYAEQLSRLLSLEAETETTRKAKLAAWTAEKKRNVADLKQLKGSLRAIQMALMQAIKTRRTEPYR
jgi:hypothetical protein